MSAAREQRLRWGAAVLGLALLLLLGLLQDEGLCDALAVSVMRVPHTQQRVYFADTLAILASGQADQAGRDAYDSGQSLDPFDRPNVYGPLWLVTGTLGLRMGDAGWVGALLGSAFLLAAVVLLAPRGPGAAFTALLLVAAPPVLLGIERGNNDLVVFLLLMGAGWLLTRPGRAPAVAGAALLGLAAVLKLYPLACLPALAARRGPGRGLARLGAGVVLACALVLLYWHRDYIRMLGLAPAPRTVFAYGLKVPVFAWYGVRDAWPWLLAGGTVTGLAAVVLLGRHAWALWAAVPLTGTATAWYVAGAAAWCFCYVANTNWTYRALLLVLPAALWLKQADDPVRGPLARGQLAVLVAMGWLTVVKSWWIGALPDGQLPVAWNWAGVILGVEQVLVAGLTLALAIGLLGWGVRRLRAGDNLPE